MGLTALVTVILGGIYLHYAIEARTQEFRTRAELLSWAFADRVAFDLAQGEPQNLEFLAGTLVLGSVLYAQVVQEGRVLVEVSRLEEPLPPAQSPAAIWQFERRTAGNLAYWDILRALPDAEGYVRLGLALEPLENAIRVQILSTIGVGVALLALVGLAAGYWARRTSTVPAPANERPVSPPTLEPSEGALTSYSPICIGELVIDEASKRVEIRGQSVELSPKEFELLSFLASEPGRVFSNREILTQVWADSRLATAQDVKQYIYFLRQKLEEDPRDPKLILTVRGFGYKLQP
jgi:hypothetical protein